MEAVNSLAHHTPRTQSFACYSTIKLSAGVTPGNYAVLLINALFAISLLIFVNTEQAFLLTEIYSVPVGEIGNVSGQLSIADEVMNLFALVLAGVLSDKVGRRVIVSAGYGLCAIALALFPHGRSYDEHPADLIAIRVVFALGSAALASTLTALLADYVAQTHLGKAAGVSGLASATGAVFTVFVLLRLPAFVCLAPTYYIAASISGVLSLVMFLGLSSQRPTDTESESDSQDLGANQDQTEQGTDTPAQSPWWDGFFALRNAVTLARHDMVVVVSYLSGFSSRGAAVTISVFISLWVNKYYQSNALCFESSGDDATFNSSALENYSQCSEDLTEPTKVACPEAFAQSSTVNGIVQVVALASSPLFGILCDKIVDPALVFLMATGLATISFSLVAVAEDPTTPAMLGLSSLLGASQIFLVVSSQWLVTMKMPVDIRGAVAGVYSLCGGVGVIFFINLGGYLFDEWKGYAPFLLVGLTNAAIFLGTLCLLADRWMKRKRSMQGSLGKQHPSLSYGSPARRETGRSQSLQDEHAEEGSTTNGGRQQSEVRELELRQV